MNPLPTPETTRRDGVLVSPVILADGAAWGLARPATRLVPAVIRDVDSLERPTETIALRVGFGYPLDVQRRIEAVRTACATGTRAEQYESFFSLAAGLLRRAHDIDRATARALLSVADDELTRLVEDVMAIVSERPPEPEEAPHD